MGDRLLVAIGRADGHDPLADAQVGRVTPLHGNQTRGLDADDREVTLLVLADDLRLVAGITDRNRHARGTVDDVAVGDDVVGVALV